MSIDWGFNFRGAGSGNPDGANETAVLGDSYPHTYTIGSDSVTAGWESGSVDVRFRNASADRRLMGINFQSSGSTLTFRVDLPSAGSYDLHFAFGDDNGTAPAGDWLVDDGGSTLATLDGSTSVTGDFRDAAGTAYSEANWPGSEQGITVTTSGTALRLEVTTSNSQRIAHMRIVTSAGGGGGATAHLLGTLGVGG